MVETILQSPFVVNLILPFLLVFTLVFAILQKTEILGKGKGQIDAIVALVFGLTVVAFGNAVDIIVQLIPFLAVSVVIILVFLILWGSVHPQGQFVIHKYVQWALGGVFALAVVVAVLWITGAWDKLYNLFAGGGSVLATNIIIIVIVIAAVAAVVFGGKGHEGGKP